MHRSLLAVSLLVAACASSNPGSGTSPPAATSAAVVDVAPSAVAGDTRAPTASPTDVATASATVREATPPPPTAMQRDADGLGIEDVVVGKGALVGAGQTPIVHYVGTLVGGAKFDSSRDRGKPFKFQLGAGHVIKGWERGIDGMRVGGVRRLEIPPAMGYGERGHPPKIPANATLLFEVELLGIE